MKVYFAGKVTKNGWRQEIIDLRSEVNWALHWDDQSLETLIQNGIEVNDQVIYNGPYVFGCDHGCFHGDGNHGAGVQIEYECGGNEPMDEDTLFDLCKSLIDSSDYVFCYLDDLTAYGTIFELGYAHAHQIPIFLCFSKQLSRKDVRDFWFSKMGACHSVYCETAREGFLQFLEWTNNQKKTSQNKPFKKTNGSQSSEDGITARQLKFLTDLLSQNQAYFDYLLGETFKPKNVIITSDLRFLTRKEAITWIRCFKAFGEQMNHYLYHRAETDWENGEELLTSLSMSERLRLFPSDLRQILSEVKRKIVEYQDYDVESLYQRYLTGEKGEWVDEKQIHKTARKVSQIKTLSSTLDPRVKYRNRAKEQTKPFLMAKNPTRLAQKIGEFVSHSVVKPNDQLLFPPLINQLDRYELAEKFLISPYFKAEDLPTDYDEKAFKEELARYIDQTIPRSYAKHYLKLSGGPSQYDVDAASFKLTYQF